MLARNGVGVTSPVVSDGFANYTPGISERRGGVTRYQSSDIKNATQQVSSSQTIVGAKQYDAFGNLTSNSGSWNGPFSYGGAFGYQTETDTGYQLLGHRYYDPTTGRFLTRDPIGDGRNWYTYCANNPVSYFDADGLKKLIIIVGGGKGEEPLIGDADALLAERIRDKFRGYGWDVVVLIAPTEEEVVKVLLEADALVFIGHANGYFGRLRGPSGDKKGKAREKLTPKFISEAFAKGGRSRPLEFVYMIGCDTTAEPETIRLWLRIAVEFAGFGGKVKLDDVLSGAKKPSIIKRGPSSRSPKIGAPRRTGGKKL